MQIFISWSGDKSHTIAIILKKYLKIMIQSLLPYLSSEDIKKGKRWYIELSKILSEAKFGIICLTKDNINSEWILFESGAISKSLDDSRVFTLLFENLSPSDIKGPLAHFQHTNFNKDDFEKLMIELNNLLEDKKIDTETLKTTFSTFWPKLEDEIKQAIEKHSLESLAFIDRNEKDYLKEILLLGRQILNNQETISEDYITYLTKISTLTDNELISPDNNDFNHPVSVIIDPVEIEEKENKKLVKVTVEKGSVNIEKSEYPKGRRGVQISIIFDSEFEENLWKLDFTFHKGNTYVSAARLPLVEKGLKDNTIWRD
jgi:hypothetical protein